MPTPSSNDGFNNEMHERAGPKEPIETFANSQVLSTPGSQKSTSELLSKDNNTPSISAQIANINSKATSICLLSVLVALLSVACMIMIAAGVQNVMKVKDVEKKLDEFNSAVQIATPGLAPGSPSTWLKIDPVNNRAPHGRLSHAACSVGSKMYIHGGLFGKTTQTYDDLWSYDEAANEWTEIATSGDKPSARLHHTMIDTADGKTLLLFGGFNNFQGQPGHDSFADLYKLDLTTMVWTRLDTSITGAKPTKRGAHDCLWLGSQQHGNMYCFGGFPIITASGHLDDLWKYNLNTNTWTQITVSPKYDFNWPEARIGFAISQISETKFHLFGGGCSVTVADDDCAAGQAGDDWIFDSVTEKFEMMNVTADSPVPGPRRATHGDVAAFGLVFLYGGVFINGTTQVKMYDDLWVLQPDAAKGGPRWMPLFPNYLLGTSARPGKLFGHSVVRINDKLVVFGGRKGSPADDGTNDLWEFHVVKPF